MSGPSDEVKRDVLPIPDQRYEGELPLDAKDPDASYPSDRVAAAAGGGAPNVLVVLLDDVGFAASSAFGGPCATPTAERRPIYCYNLLGLQRFKIEADAAIPPGTHQVRMEFAYDGGGPAKGGTVALYVDGEKTGEGRVEATVPLIFSADETADVGRDTASPVSDDYDGERSIFTGTVNWVQIDLGEDAEDADHLITPDERLRIAMARQ